MVKTVPEYFRRRYGKPSGIITSLIMFVPLIGLTAGQFIASSVILSTMLNLNYKTAVLIVGVVVTIYAIMGGLWSVTLTDFVQVFLIVIGMIIALPFGMNLAGGWDNVVANVPAETFDMFKGYNVMDVISLTIMYVATFTVGQEAVSRYYAARDGKAARQGSVLAAIVNFIYAFVPTLMANSMLQTSRMLVPVMHFRFLLWKQCRQLSADCYLQVSYLPQCQVLTQTFLVPDRSLQMIFTRL